MLRDDEHGGSNGQAEEQFLIRALLEGRPANNRQGSGSRDMGSWRDRVKRAQSVTDPEPARRAMACLLASTKPAAHPIVLREAMASLLAAEFHQAGQISADLADVDIQVEDVMSVLEKHVFCTPRPIADKLGSDLNAVLEKARQWKARGSPAPANNVQSGRDEGQDSMKPSFMPPSDQPFTTAKKMIGGASSTTQPRKFLGNKRVAGPSAPLKDDSSGIDTSGQNGGGLNDLSCYNLAKPPPKPKVPVAVAAALGSGKGTAVPNQSKDSDPDPLLSDERLQGIEPRLVELIRSEIITKVDHLTWESVAGLEHAKKVIYEAVILPFLRPYAIDVVGESEKLVRALFAVARCLQPSVIFIDEIDSMLTQRSDGEVEATRRLKTEFLVQMDGAQVTQADRVLVIGATNRPQELDEAARRRLTKRLYIPLPDPPAREKIVRNLLNGHAHILQDVDFSHLATSLTAGYSGADMDNLCREAAMGPIRDILGAHPDVLSVRTDTIRPISMSDFEYALTQVRASVSQSDLDLYVQWEREFGALSK